jgi:Domain of unknown function (DUF6894)
VWAGGRSNFSAGGPTISAPVPLHELDNRLLDLSSLLNQADCWLRTMRAVQEEAARALSGIAYDAMRLDGGERQHMAIEVRDEHGPVMEVKFSFEIAPKQ